MKLHLQGIGFAGSLFSLLCCLGFGPLIAILSAIGAGFLINDAVLAPLLILFLVIGGVGLGLTYRRHRHFGPLAVHLASAVAVVVFTFMLFVQPIVWLGIVGLLVASTWDFVLAKRATA
ncbi:MerC domain-containing protein [bacterium]|nr:MerC domain-containing protein [bacterium]